MNYFARYGIGAVKSIIVDIGHADVRLLGVVYSKKSMMAIATDHIEIDEPLESIPDIVAHVLSFADVNSFKNPDILISLPESCAKYRIVQVSNVKQAELDKIIRAEHYSFANINSDVIDWGYLGERVENSDTVHYCTVAAIQRETVENILETFKMRKLNVSNISIPLYNLVNLSHVIHDCKYHNVVYADETRIVVFADNVAVYARETTHNSVVDEVGRIVSMYESESHIRIAKVLCGGALHDDMVEAIAANSYIKAEPFELYDGMEISENGISVVSDAATNGMYNNALGLAIGELL